MEGLAAVLVKVEEWQAGIDSPGNNAVKTTFTHLQNDGTIDHAQRTAPH